MSREIVALLRATTQLTHKASFVQQLRHDAGITDVDH